MQIPNIITIYDGEHLSHMAFGLANICMRIQRAASYTLNTIRSTYACECSTYESVTCS